MAVSTIHVTKPEYPGLFGGMGFNNVEASCYPMIEPEYMNQVVQKCHCELSPGFARLWGGFADWTKEAMDSFAEYCKRTFCQTETMLYLVPGRGSSFETAEERRQWANDVAERLAYLYFDKGIRNIKYYCMCNELTIDSTWGNLQHQMALFKEYHEYLYRTFQRRRLPIGLIVPDVSEPTNYSALFWAIGNMRDISAAYTAHTYLGGKFDAEDLGMYKWYTRLLASCADAAQKQEKRFIVSEYGWGQFHGNPITADGDTADCAYDSVVGCSIDYPRYTGTPKEAYSLLTIAEMNLAAINAGVFATGYWTFVDYPDPQINTLPFMGWGTEFRYNKCGVLRWNDFDSPAMDSYWCLGLMTRFMKQNTQIMYHKSDDPLLRTAVLRDQAGRVSVCIVNRHPTVREVQLAMGELVDRPMRIYQYDPCNVPRNRFADLQDHIGMTTPDSDGNVFVTLGGNTVTILTTDYEERIPPLAINVRIENGILLWDAVTEPEHRYYRVFANGAQVASTVATALPGAMAQVEYQVCSVDLYNNCAIKCKQTKRKDAE